MNILFVCTGNSCRSVMAHYLTRKLAADRGLDVEVRSAGLAAHPGFAIPREVHTALASRGVKGVEHTPTPMSLALADWADEILVMERNHLDFVRTEYPGHAQRTHLLRARAGLDPDQIGDPIGQSADVYAHTMDQIQEAVEKRLDELVNA